VLAKVNFKVYTRQQGVSITLYHTDNGIFSCFKRLYKQNTRQWYIAV